MTKPKFKEFANRPYMAEGRGKHISRDRVCSNMPNRNDVTYVIGDCVIIQWLADQFSYTLSLPYP